MNSDFDYVDLDVGAGVDVLTVNGVDIKLNYDGRFSDDSEMHSSGARVGVKF